MRLDSVANHLETNIRTITNIRKTNKELSEFNNMVRQFVIYMAAFRKIAC